MIRASPPISSMRRRTKPAASGGIRPNSELGVEAWAMGVPTES